jgi:hypothetical protein
VWTRGSTAPRGYWGALITTNMRVHHRSASRGVKCNEVVIVVQIFELEHDAVQFLCVSLRARETA